MSRRIPQQFIDDLLARTDIIDVISERVSLKKAGRNYQALCPFHKEKSPSFSANQEKQFYYCFGCGASGNAIGFAMAYDHATFPEAVEVLARRAGMQLQELEQDAGSRHNDRLFELLNEAAAWYAQRLFEDTNRRAQGYVQHRQLDAAVVAAFKLGYAPGGSASLYNRWGKQRQQHLLDAGLLVENKERKTVYDRFRDRIMFPIRDERGRVLGFGGRVLGDEKPKYLNSPETSVFIKGRLLYGLYEARRANRTLPQLLVVEGYMDVIALAQQGITCAVATLGTATTTEQLSRLFRHSDQVVFCFDGDEAGTRAAWRALENALPVMKDGRLMRFLFLPPGEDPDSLVRREGAEAFLARLADRRQALAFEDCFFRHFERQTDTTTMDGKAQLVHKVVPFLRRMPDGAFKKLMMDRLGSLSQLGLATIASLAGTQGAVESAERQERPEPAAAGLHQQTVSDYQPEVFPGFGGERLGGVEPAGSQAELSVLLGPAQRALRVLLERPDLAGLVPVNSLAEVAGEDQDIRHLVAVAQGLQDRPATSTYGLLGSWYGTALGERLLALMRVEMPVVKADELLRQCITAALDGLRRRQLKSTALPKMVRLQQTVQQNRRGWIAGARQSEREDAAPQAEQEQGAD
ncbi:MAG: DNA primase [Kistimonas sp.]|nr:DNA primase [Kistimonas sp.]